VIHNAVVRCLITPSRELEIREAVLDDALDECGYERRWDEERFEPSQRTDVAGLYRLDDHRYVATVRGPADRRGELEILLEHSAVFADAVRGGSVVEEIRVVPDPRSQMDVR
jgi:hypothetical protein